MKRQTSLCLSAFFLAALGSLTCRALADDPPVYMITDLGNLDLSSSLGQSLNASGEVVGLSSSDGGFTHAFLFSGGGLLDLGTLTGASKSYAQGLNSAGEVVGYADTADTSDGFLHAFLYSNGQMQDLGTLPFGHTSNAQAINATGQIAGDSDTVSGAYHAFLWTPKVPNDVTGTMVDLGVLPGGNYSDAYALNDNGQVAGLATTATGINHAFLWTPTTPNGTTGTIQDIDSPSSPYSIAYGINNTGQAVGAIKSPSDGQLYAFIYAGGAMKIIGGPDTVAYGINYPGQVVGSYGVSNGGTGAFLYSGGTLFDLSTTLLSNPGWQLQAAVAINDNGQIAGYGITPDFKQHAFLLTPMPTAPQDTTPPTTTASLSGTEGQNGWYTGDVTVSLSAQDSGSGVDATYYTIDGVQQTYISSFTVSGNAKHTITFWSKDNAGNTEDASNPANSQAINIDSVAPVISLANIGLDSNKVLQSTATSVNGAIVSYGQPTATDNLSGVAGSVVCTPASGSQFKLGTNQVSCSVSDNAGNQANQTFNVSVTYAWSGILQPINANGSSVFKQGSTVPVKFKLTGASAGITNAIANLTYTQVGTTSSDVNESVSTSAADTGNQFRYDATSGQYIFNMSTKGMVSGGKYLLSIDLHDGVARTVQIGLR